MSEVYQYQEYHRLATDPLGDCIDILDHAMAFDQNGQNVLLRQLNDRVSSRDRPLQVNMVYLIPPEIKALYPHLDIRFKFEYQKNNLWSPLLTARFMPEPRYKRFMTSFNGSMHQSRILLTALLHKLSWWNDSCTKDFDYTMAQLDGSINLICAENTRFWRKFFVDPQAEKFYLSRYTIQRPDHMTLDHGVNINVLQPYISSSFVNIVSESMATNHVPFVTEKFLYSVVTHGLFVSYAPPGWHQHIRDFYGFKLYDTLFDYTFDDITNPVHRAVALTTMLSRFHSLSQDDWHDLHRMMRDDIDFNREHFLSGDSFAYIERFQDHDL